MSDLFWLSDAQIARLEPYFPKLSTGRWLQSVERPAKGQMAARRSRLWRRVATR